MLERTASRHVISLTLVTRVTDTTNKRFIIPDNWNQPTRDLHVQTAPCWVERGSSVVGLERARSTAV